MRHKKTLEIFLNLCDSFAITLKTFHTVRVHAPTYPCGNDSVTIYFFTTSDYFDVSVIDAPPLTLRENRINQRRCGA